MELDKLLGDAIKGKEKIHVGDLLGICSIKHSELPEEMWRYKGIDVKQKHSIEGCSKDHHQLRQRL